MRLALLLAAFILVKCQHPNLNYYQSHFLNPYYRAMNYFEFLHQPFYQFAAEPQDEVWFVQTDKADRNVVNQLGR